MFGHFTICAVLLAITQTGEVALRQLVVGSEQEAVAARARLASGDGEYMGRMKLAELRTEVRTAIESIKPGEITNPVRLGNEYVLFQVVPEAESRWIDLDEAGAQALANGKTSEAAADFEQALSRAETDALGDARIARSLDSLAGTYWIQGRSADAEKLYRRAFALLERLKASELEIAQVLTGLGMTLVDQTRFTEAAPLYERARSIREKSLGPDHPEVAATVEVFQRAVVAELFVRLSTAAVLNEFRDRELIAGIRELVSLSRLNESTYLRLKDILLQGGLNEETEEILRLGLGKFPESRILRIYLADVLAATGRTQDALVVLEEASRLSAPERQQQAIIYQRIGDMQSALTNFDAALMAYRRALELDSASPSARVKLGKAYFSSGRLGEAVAEFERAVREEPSDGDAYLNLSEAQLAISHWEQASTAADRAIELGVSDSRALYLLGTALVRMGQRERGQSRLQEFARVEAGFEEAAQRNREITAITVAAAAALRKGDGKSAVEQLSRAITTFPNHAGLRMKLAVAQSRISAHEKAIESLESLLEEDLGRRFLIHKTLAEEYALLGNLEASRLHRQMYLDARESELIK
jgi:tetratricopeptide (TPR) repeat protein